MCFTDCRKAFSCANQVKVWNILRQMRILEHLIVFLQSLSTGEEATVGRQQVEIDWLQVDKGVRHHFDSQRYIEAVNSSNKKSKNIDEHLSRRIFYHLKKGHSYIEITLSSYFYSVQPERNCLKRIGLCLPAG